MRRREFEPGRASCWVRTDTELVAGERVSATATALGLVDVANGISPIVSSENAVFPNLDLTIHLFRVPRSEWLGLDTVVSIGPDGAGATQSVMHDEDGPFGTVAQALTVRPR